MRPHPQSLRSEADLIDALRAQFPESERVVWDLNPENLNSLMRADVMISDFSGIIFDYAFLRDRPFLYINPEFNVEIYDASDVSEEPWKFQFVRRAGVELTEEMIPSILDVIRGLEDDSARADARRAGKETAWQYIGESGKRTVDFLVAKQSEVSSC